MRQPALITPSAIAGNPDPTATSWACHRPGTTAAARAVKVTTNMSEIAFARTPRPASQPASATESRHFRLASGQRSDSEGRYPVATTAHHPRIESPGVFIDPSPCPYDHSEWLPLLTLDGEMVRSRASGAHFLGMSRTGDQLRRAPRDGDPSLGA